MLFKKAGTVMVPAFLWAQWLQYPAVIESLSAGGSLAGFFYKHSIIVIRCVCIQTDCPKIG